MKFQTYGFVREKILEQCEKFSSYEDEIEYLERIKVEYETNPPKLDPNTRNPIKFVDFVDKQIQYRKASIERDKKAAEEDDDLCRITGDRGNIIRIFEAMKKTGIIDTNTKPKYIVKIFFREKEAIRETSKYYSNKSKDIEKLETKTTSTELVNFVKVLVEESFGGKREILQKIKEHIAML
ncbi:MAG: hypothetical protein IH949_05795 [Bacteroidetes bacterium]|nr:hypothetical protein [Bacteroidota bacterium]